MPGLLPYHLLSYQDTSLPPAPSRAQVAQLLDGLLALMLSHAFSRSCMSPTDLDRLYRLLVSMLDASFAFAGGDAQSERRALAFFSSLPDTRIRLLSDAEAMYDGDPAATSPREVMLCYPGFYAIAVYRLAHTLHTLAAPILPRLFTEHAHSLTGIDIHPAAVIGERFFIDHGTGIVIGETATIGNCVKLYHGVTLGARSFKKDGEGRLVRGTKRHPDIRDGVVIYANATVLGGDTVVGENCVIGANVRITASVPAGSTVTCPAECAARRYPTPDTHT